MRKALIAPLLLVLIIGYSEASKQSAVEGLRYSSYKSHTRVVVDLNGPVKGFTRRHLSNPERLFIDLKDCSLSRKTKHSLSVKDGVLKTVRMAQFDKNIVRVVFDLGKSEKNYAFMLENPYRLVVDIYAQKGNMLSRKTKTLRHKKTLAGKSIHKIKTVVIDPGHGGRDAGAVGPRGLREKDITLSVGKKLGKMLKKKHGMEVVYTRKRDKFVPLNDRTEIANSKNADLFISIHTNANNARNVRGIETYFLNWTNNTEAMKVAARENRISLKKMKKIKNDLNTILDDLGRKYKNEESMRLAYSVQNTIVKTLKKDYRRIEDLGVKYALFFVLLGAEMPSILVEISFISNREEEKRLSMDSYKNKIAEAIAKGINSYVTQSTLIVNPVKERDREIVSNGVKKTGDEIQPQG